MDAEKALAAMDGTCGCRSLDAEVRHAATIFCHLPEVCACSDPMPNRKRPTCRWPGHAAARTLARAAFEAGEEWRSRWGHTNPPHKPKWLTETSR